MDQNNFVEFNRQDICVINRVNIDDFVTRAIESPMKKYRYCLHHAPCDTLHEMIIVTTRQDIKYPDKHLNTTESNIILKGKLLVVLFSDEGKINETFILEPENTFYYRCERNQYHMTIPLSDVAVYIEIKEGPFTKETNIFPDWAPKRTDLDAIKVFNKKIESDAIKKMEK